MLVGCGGDDATTTPPSGAPSSQGGSGGGGAGGSSTTAAGAGGVAGGAGDAGSAGMPMGPQEPDWKFEGIYGVPNLDDDDKDGTADWVQGNVAGDDDVRRLTLPELPEGYSARVAYTGPDMGIRIGHKGESIFGEGGKSTELTLSGMDAKEAFRVEFADYNLQGSLQLELINPKGEVSKTATIDVMSSPLLLNHHLMPATRVWAVELPTSAAWNNRAYIDEYKSVLGDRFEAVDGNLVGGDVWIQDEFEWSALQGNGGEKLEVIVDSIRDRGLDPLAEARFSGKDQAVGVWGSGNPNTYDSFGNLEVSPPVTVNGVKYPFGRIYYGQRGSAAPAQGLRDFLAAQRVQAPFAIDSTWLCVGHVDEFISTVPDPSSPKGFKLLFADTREAYKILDAADPNITIPRYDGPYGVGTVGQLRGVSSVRSFSEKVQQDYLDPIRKQMQMELGLTDEDVILIPTVFRRLNPCGGRAVALTPGTINLIVANDSNEKTHIFAADPYLRPGGASDTQDLFAADFRKRMPAGLEVTFLNDWETYHLADGEVHCGSNTRRTPTAKWWESGLELIKGGK